MILVFEVIFASIAAVLSILSLRTLKAIKHLGVGKSFWVPVFLSGVFFTLASVATILYEANFLLTTIAGEIAQVNRLLALCALSYGIYSYSRRVNESLTTEFSIPERIVEESLEIEVPVEEDPQREARNQKRRVRNSPRRETSRRCKHQFGYLLSLPKNASIPDECLSCERIVECKHSLENTLESRAQTQ